MVRWVAFCTFSVLVVFMGWVAEAACYKCDLPFCNGLDARTLSKEECDQANNVYTISTIVDLNCDDTLQQWCALMEEVTQDIAPSRCNMTEYYWCRASCEAFFDCIPDATLALIGEGGEVPTCDELSGYDNPNCFTLDPERIACFSDPSCPPFPAPDPPPGACVPLAYDTSLWAVECLNGTDSGDMCQVVVACQFADRWFWCMY